jgi:hypothetical protein
VVASIATHSQVVREYRQRHCREKYADQGRIHAAWRSSWLHLYRSIHFRGDQPPPGSDEPHRADDREHVGRKCVCAQDPAEKKWRAITAPQNNGDDPRAHDGSAGDDTGERPQPRRARPQRHGSRQQGERDRNHEQNSHQSRSSLIRPTSVSPNVARICREKT